MKLRIGTANFTRQYGLNSKNIVSDTEIRNILGHAKSLGILSIDTAQEYGDSEKCIGINVDKKEGWDICTKIRITPENRADIKNIVSKSKASLGERKPNTVLIHNATEVKKSYMDLIVRQLSELQEKGEIDNFGISAYELSEIQFFKEQYPRMNFFQVPDNICSQNLLNNSFLLDLKEKNNHLDVRSIFLQGLLLNSEELVLSQNPTLIRYLDYFRKYIASQNVSALEACLQYAKKLTWAESIVVGVRSAKEIQIINQIFLESTFDIELYPEKIPMEISDPRKWKY